MQRQPVVTVPNLALPPGPAPSHPCPTGPSHSPTRRCTQELTPLGDSAGAAPSLAPPLPRRPRPAPCRLGTSPPRPSPPLEAPPPRTCTACLPSGPRAASRCGTWGRRCARADLIAGRWARGVVAVAVGPNREELQVGRPEGAPPYFPAGAAVARRGLLLPPCA